MKEHSFIKLNMPLDTYHMPGIVLEADTLNTSNNLFVFIKFLFYRKEKYTPVLVYFIKRIKQINRHLSRMGSYLR